MYFNRALYRRALRASLLEQPFRLRRWAFVLAFNAIFWVFWLAVAAGRALDHVFFPRFRRQTVERPVFIVAPPRSGTTLTQKLLARDEEQFVHVKLYHTIFPSVCFYRLFQGIAWLDDAFQGAFSRFARSLEKLFFSGWNDQHPLRFTEPEEDDGFFVYTMVTEAIYLLFPQVDKLWEAGFADALPPEERRKVMAYYRSCLQRHLYASGRGRTLLSKATQFSGSVESLLEAFPDARFITIVRDPYHSIASHVNVFYDAWVAHSPEIAKDSPESHAYARLAAAWYRHLFEFRRIAPAGQYFCLRYADLVENPARAIEGVYRHFGLPLGDGFRRHLADAAGRQRTFRSRHQYALEDFGLDRAWLRRELGEVLDFYGLDETLAGGMMKPGARRLSVTAKAA